MAQIGAFPRPTRQVRRATAVSTGNRRALDDDKILNVEQARRYLNLPRSTFRRWRKEGVVSNKGRWTKEELDAIVVPPNKPRGRHAKKPEAQNEAPAGDEPAENPLPDAPYAPEASSEERKTPPSSPAPSEKAGGFDPKDPYKANLPQKRPRGGSKGTKAAQGGSEAAKLDQDDEGFEKSSPNWEDEEGLWSK
jgi:hypothetical protein